VRRTYTRYRDARRSLRVPASQQSRHGLDWLNFFVADMQTGYGSFVAYYLAGVGWSQTTIGVALTIDNLLAVIGQIPGGALADATTRKRSLAAVAIGAERVLAIRQDAPPSGDRGGSTGPIALSKLRVSYVPFDYKNAGTKTNPDA
jgi:hypothetical protein